MAYSLRRYREGDAEPLHALTLAAIAQIGPAAYSREQVAVWASRHGSPGRIRERVANGHSIYVAADERGLPVAFALLEQDGHLDQLYCHPDHSRRELADQLLALAETEAGTRGIARLYTEASELARPAFERCGYSITHRRDFEIDGVAIHNYAMEKRLG
ncbi:GNAT family N-acetyltransferase [Altererythrobacter luteolus]|uniref:GNAT family N-acetyltransferase n=1 Tax=Pontixanthobacter luteolus TaxID=295089 RepID=A0A6I4V0T1_9SPHN|nr:GNAT family N-acetyltransferase [Pontixanthobacter luteolus]MXP46706.1 GNAT family N-acetyltransferase [Pontixanthobacter luteolus]